MIKIKEINAIYEFFDIIYKGGINKIFNARNTAMKHRCTQLLNFKPIKFMGGLIEIRYTYNYRENEKRFLASENC